MTVHEQAITKIHKLPEQLASEVNRFIDFLLFKQDGSSGQLSSQTSETPMLAESDIGDYAQNLADYEELLARGEIQW